MLKKFVSLLLLYTALAIMLGHNLIPHHHHHFEHEAGSHHHDDGHHENNDAEDESDDWGHFFEGLQHGAEGLTFITSHSSSNIYLKQIPQFAALHTTNFIFIQFFIEARQNAPPSIAYFYISQNFLPCGLRAPPIFIV